MVEKNPLMMERRRGTVVLYPGTVEDRREEYDEAIDRAYLAELSGAGRAAAAAEADRIATEKDDYMESVREQAIKVVLEGITERRVQQLRDQHPARKGDKLDEAVGFNRDEFPGAFVRACLIEPEVTDEQWAEFVDEASAGRLRRLHEKAEEVTFGDVDLPKSSAVSALTRQRERDQRRRGEQA